MAECEDAVSRQLAIDTLLKWMRLICINNNGEVVESDDMVAIRNILKSLPPAQLERKKGHWVPVDSLSAFGGDESAWISRGNPIAFYYCSECKKQAYAGEDGESLLTDFCPDCGADMRGEELYV